MLVKSLCVLDQRCAWPTDYNCWVFPEACCFITVVCCRSLLPVGKWSCGGGAGDERCPLGAATARAGRRSAEGAANPVAIKR
jgi:hypothetical protein